MTGWGQDGPLARHAGHDINYVALAGALAHIGRAGQPPGAAAEPGRRHGRRRAVPRLRRGVRAARGAPDRPGAGGGHRHDRRRVLADDHGVGLPGPGPLFPGARAQRHRLRGAVYDVYECADGNTSWSARSSTGLRPPDGRARPPSGRSAAPPDQDRWPAARERLAAVFRERTRDEWCARLEGEPDICFAPVLDLAQAEQHPHHQARGTFSHDGGMIQPPRAPVQRHPRRDPAAPRAAGEHTDEVLAEWLSLDGGALDRLRGEGSSLKFPGAPHRRAA